MRERSVWGADSDALTSHLLQQALSETNEAKALSLLVCAAKEAMRWTGSVAGSELEAGGHEGDCLALLRASDKLLLEAAAEQAQFLQTQPLPEREAVSQAGGGGFDDDEAW